MSLTLLPLVVLLGGVGAIARYRMSGAVGRAAARWTTPTGARVPGRAVGTAAVNLLGAAAVGALLALAGPAADSEWGAIVGAGFFGSFTTFSAWMIEVVELWRSGRPVAALLHLFGTLLAGVAVAALAFRLAGGG